MFEYICIKKTTKINIWIYFYNKFDMDACLNKYLYGKLYEYSTTFDYSKLFSHTHERISEYVCTKKLTWANVQIYASENQKEQISE